MYSGYYLYDGLRRVSGLRSEPVVFVENPTRSPHLTEKDDPDPVVAESDPFVVSSVHRTPAQNSQREGRGPFFSMGCGDQCGVLHGDYRFPT